MQVLKRIILFYLPPIIWMGIIFTLSGKQRISVSNTYSINFLFFKTLHVLEYACLFLLFNRAIEHTSRIPKKMRKIVALIAVFFYALSDEIHQTFVPTREGAFRDVIIDCLGAGLAWIFLTHITPKMPRKLWRLAKNWQLF